MPPVSSPFIIQKSPLTSRVIYEGGVWLFNVGFFLFIAALLAAGGLFLYQRMLLGTQAEWVGRVEDQLVGLEQDSAAELIDFSNALSLARELLSGHVITSNVFTFLEAMTHQRVRFTSFSITQSTHEIRLSGVAASYRTVAEQV